MKKVLITGGTGFLGKNFIELADKEKYEIHLITRELHFKGVNNYHGELLDHQFVLNIIKNIRADILVLFAWDVKNQNYWNSMENVKWINNTLFIAEQFLEQGGKYIVFSGTSASYDYSNKILMEDRNMEQPDTVYGLSKLYTSNMLSLMAKSKKASYLEARLFSIFGIYERRGRLITNTIDLLLKGQKIVNNKWSLYRDYIYIKDAVRAILHLMSIHAEGVFNISSGSVIQIKDILEIIATKMGKMDMLYFAEFDGTGEYRYIRGDNSKLVRTGFTYQYSFEEAVEEEIKWYCSV